MDKTLMIIGAGIEQIPGIQLAKKMGLFVLVTDGNPTAPGFRYADAYGVVSTYDISKTLAFAVKYNKRRKIDGVMTLASDVPLTVSTVAKKLGLLGNSMRTAKLASDKLLMKEQLSKYGVPVPEFTSIKNEKEIIRFIQRVGYPIVLKPVDSRGARGVIRITKGIDLKWAFNTSMYFSSSKRIMAEKFLAGPQFSTESIIYDNRIITPGIARRNYEYLDKYKPYIIENGGDMPVFLSACQREQLNQILFKAALAIGMECSSLKGDIVLTKDGFKIIEIAARLSGGWFCTDEIPFSTGVDIVSQVIRLALGMPPDFDALMPRYAKRVVLRYLFFDKGRIMSISGIRRAKKIPGVIKIGINISPGSIIDKVSDHTKRVGYVIVSRKNRHDAILTTNKAFECINIKWQN